MKCKENWFNCTTCSDIYCRKNSRNYGRTTPPPPPPPSQPKPTRHVKPQNQSLGDRVKELIQYAETPEEMAVLVETYKKILELNKRYSC